jgi:hypothetical protein
MARSRVAAAHRQIFGRGESSLPAQRKPMTRRCGRDGAYDAQRLIPLLKSGPRKSHETASGGSPSFAWMSEFERLRHSNPYRLGQKEAALEKTQAELEKASEAQLSHMEGGKVAKAARQQKAKIRSK